MKRYYLSVLLILCVSVYLGATSRDGREFMASPTTLNAPPGDTAHGLIGYYYQDPSDQSRNFDTLKLVRVDTLIQFAWGNDAPTKTDFSSPDNFSVRWIGLIEPPVTGTYTFHLNADDGSRLYINGVDVADDWPNCCRDYSGTIDLVAGKKYPVRLEMHEKGGGAGVSYFRWEADGLPLEQVPPQALYAITPATASKPKISPVAGLYEGQTTVSLTTQTEGGKIYYTLDGSEPTDQSILYDGPFEITASGSVIAKAYKDGMFSSALASSTYTIIPPLAPTPTFSPSAGIYDDPVIVHIQTAGSGTRIYYTLDGSTPDSTSNLYTAGIEIDSTTRIKAFSTKDGYTPSQIGSATFTILPPGVAAPVFHATSSGSGGGLQVSITCDTVGAIIHYALDNAGLNAGSPVYSAPIQISKTTTLKAYAEKQGVRDSKVSIMTYVIGTDSVKAQAPQFTSPSGHYNSVLQVSLYTDTKGAQIYYTTDGSQPTENSDVFFTPIQINDSVKIQAFAQAGGMKPSDIVSATYVISHQQLDTSIIVTNLQKPVLSIFPNPASNLARLSWTHMVYNLDGVHLTVTDSRGVVMKKAVIKGGYTYYDLNTSSFADGVYFVRITSGQMTVYGKVLVGR